MSPAPPPNHQRVIDAEAGVDVFDPSAVAGEGMDLASLDPIDLDTEVEPYNEDQLSSDLANGHRTVHDMKGEVGGKRRGRPTRWTATMRQEVLLVVGDGGSIADAAAWILLHPAQLYAEFKKNPAFGVMVARAGIGCKLYHIRRVREGAHSWQASAWFLERRWRSEYGLIQPSEGEADRLIKVRRIVRGNTPSVMAGTATNADAVGRAKQMAGAA